MSHRRLLALAIWAGLAGCASPPAAPTPAPSTPGSAATDAPTAAPTAVAAPTAIATTGIDPSTEAVATPATGGVPAGGPAPAAATPAPTAAQAPDPVGQTSSSQASPPAPLPVRQFSLPPIDESRLENGLTLVVVPRSGLPYLHLQLVLPGGQAAAPADLAGLPQIVADLLTRGTTTRSAQDVAGAIEQVGGSLGATAGPDQITVSASILSEYADLAFDVLGDVALNPTFPQAELELRRQRILTGLRADLANPGSVANRAFDAVVYGPHPYGRSATDESLRAITRDDVAAYYAARRTPDGAILVVVGDTTPEDAARRARAAFGQWVPSDSSPGTYPPAPSRSERTIYLVDRPGSSQAEVRVGHLGLAGPSPERHAAQVANQVLGGSATSRLFLNLREQRGYTYGVYSGFSLPRDLGDFTIGAAVRNEVVEPALREILAEMERLRDGPLPPEELASARSFLIGSYAVALQTSEALAGQIASLKLRGLPLDTIRAYPQTIEGIDEDAARQAARRHVRPSEAAIVVVGDGARIRDGLAAVGPVIAIDPEGRPLP